MTVTFIGDADVLDWLRSAAEDPAMEFWKFTIETAIDDIERYRADLNRIAELEALLREIDAKVIFEAAVGDGTGNDLQERVEAALGIGSK